MCFLYPWDLCFMFYFQNIYDWNVWMSFAHNFWTKLVNQITKQITFQIDPFQLQLYLIFEFKPNFGQNCQIKIHSKFDRWQILQMWPGRCVRAGGLCMVVMARPIWVFNWGLHYISLFIITYPHPINATDVSHWSLLTKTQGDMVHQN